MRSHSTSGVASSRVPGRVPSSMLMPAAPMPMSAPATSHTARALSSKPRSMSTLTGTEATRQMRAQAAISSFAGMRSPSAYPSDQAMPALVVPMAFAPARSTMRALAASQAFTRTSGAGPAWSR